MTDRRSLYLAFFAALLLHATVLTLTWNLDLIGRLARRAAATHDKTSPVVELFLAPDEKPRADLPKAYTSVPERQEAEKPPDNPDFLALRNSRAADRLPGGEAKSAPGAERTETFPQVAIRKDTGGGSAGGVAVVPVPQSVQGRPDASETGEGAEAKRGREDEARADGDVARGADTGEAQTPRRGEEKASVPKLADLLSAANSSVLDPRRGDPGDRGFDYDQQAQSRPGENMIRFGDFQLSTIDWDFAPWLEAFKRAFLPNWIPPYAYHLGVIDGWTRVRVVVEPDGTVSDIKVIAKQGHESLHQASVAAIRATAPLPRLPADFPDPELVFTVELHYSAREVPPPPARPAPTDRDDAAGRRRR